MLNLITILKKDCDATYNMLDLAYKEIAIIDSN